MFSAFGFSVTCSHVQAIANLFYFCVFLWLFHQCNCNILLIIKIKLKNRELASLELAAGIAWHTHGSWACDCLDQYSMMEVISTPVTSKTRFEKMMQLLPCEPEHDLEAFGFHASSLASPIPTCCEEPPTSLCRGHMGSMMRERDAGSAPSCPPAPAPALPDNNCTRDWAPATHVRPSQGLGVTESLWSYEEDVSEVFRKMLLETGRKGNLVMSGQKVCHLQ